MAEEEPRQKVTYFLKIFFKRLVSDLISEDMILEEELIRLLPQIYQANAMSDELKKNAKFEIVLVAPQSRGQRTGTTEVDF